VSALSTQLTYFLTEIVNIEAYFYGSWCKLSECIEMRTETIFVLCWITFVHRWSENRFRCKAILVSDSAV